MSGWKLSAQSWKLANEDKAARYHRLGRRSAIAGSLWTFALLVAFLVSGASAALRSAAGSIAGAFGASAIVAVYIFVLCVLIDLATFPITFYKGYVLEHRYGLSTETFAGWLVDHLKAAAIGVAFAEIGGTFVYYSLRHWPSAWWLVSGAVYSLFTIVLVNLAPVLLLPLFYKFKPLEQAALRERLTTLAARAKTSIRGVYEWKLSDRTKKANAALAGIGNTRRIILSDTLLAEYSEDEIEVILAHELSHHVHRDIWSAIALDSSLTFAGFYAADLALRASVGRLGLNGPADIAGAPALLISAALLGLLVRPVTNAVSRSHERRADRYALTMTRNPTAFQSAMRRLGQQNLAEENPSKLVQAFFYTHPPIRDRLKVAKDWQGTSRSLNAETLGR